MAHKTLLYSVLSISSLMLTTLNSEASYDGDYALSSYSIIFHGTNDFPAGSSDTGNTKEIFTEFSDLSLEINQNFTIDFNESSMQRSIFNAPSYDTENLVYNSYTNMFSVITNETETGTYTPLANNTVKLQTGDGEGTLYFNANTNVALLFMTDENGAEFEEVGLGVLVRKSAGLSNADLNGTYTRYLFGHENSGATPRGWGNVDSLYLEQSIMQFDGAGNYTEESSEWSASRIITENIVTNNSDHYVNSYCTVLAPETTNSVSSNIYSVSSTDGSLLIGISEGSVPTQLSADANLIATALAQPDSESAATYFVVAVKQPTNMSTNPIDAVYFTAEIDEEFGWSSPDAGNNHNRAEVGRSYFFLKSDGTFAIRGDYWSIGNTLENFHQYEPPHGVVSYNYFTTESEPRIIEFSNGTYSIETNGIITLAFSDGEMGMAQISENEQYVVYGFPDGEEGYAENFMGIGIKREAPPEAAAPVVFNNDFTMTPTGGVFSVSVPTNTNVEILHTSDLTWSDWNSLGTTNSSSGTLQINDTNAVANPAQFYNATFGIW